MITSAQNPRVRLARSLIVDRQTRLKESAFVIEGVRLVEEAFISGWIPSYVLYSSSLSGRGLQLVKAFESHKVELVEISEQLMRAISDTDTPQGVLAVIPNRSVVLPQELDFLVICDNLRDPGNLGTILRSAASAAVQAVITTPGSVDAFSPKVLRSGMGAHFSLPVVNLSWDEITVLRASNRPSFKLLLAAGDGKIPIWEADLRQPLAIIIGGEAEGAGAEASRLADLTIQIPIPGKTESLNAAVAAGIILFEVVHQRKV